MTRLKLSCQHRPDLILLDLQLPGVRGDAALREVCISPEISTISIVMLSTDVTAHSQERLLALGADDYLSKPLNVNHLTEKIEAKLALRP